MRKYYAAAVLTALLAVSVFTGCGASGSKPTEAINAAKETEAENGEKESSGNKAAERSESEEKADAESSKKGTFSGDVSIEEQVLYDQDGLRITAKEYVKDSIWGDGIRLLIENDSDKELGVSCRDLIVNDYMISDLFSTTVAAGKKANENLTFSKNALKLAGIKTVAKVETHFHLFDPENYHGILDTDGVEIHTSAYDSVDLTPDDSGLELFNDGGIRIVGKGVNTEDLFGQAIIFYCENNYGSDVSISVDDLSINGFMIDPLFSSTILNGKHAIKDMTIFKTELEKNGIESIDDVELSFRISDADTYKKICKTDPIRFTVDH